MVHMNEYVKPKLPQTAKHIVLMWTFLGSSFYTDTNFLMVSIFGTDCRWLGKTKVRHYHITGAYQVVIHKLL